MHLQVRVDALDILYDMIEWILVMQLNSKGLSFISNRQWRKERTFSASELAGMEAQPGRPHFSVPSVGN
jgi:hypothetical protein